MEWKGAADRTIGSVLCWGRCENGCLDLEGIVLLAESKAEATSEVWCDEAVWI